MKILLVGSTGMLGSMILKVFSRETDWEIVAPPSNVLNAENVDHKSLRPFLVDVDWAINAAGKIKPYVHDNNLEQVETAIKVNSIFPHELQKAASLEGAKVIQIATDCVYSGNGGYYTEVENHDPADAYGKTKSLGEVNEGGFYNLRCSIVGPEVRQHSSLMDWFLSHKTGDIVSGYTNHQWNGVTTLQFAKICRGIIKQNMSPPRLQHVIPRNSVSKFELLHLFADYFGRDDIIITRDEADTVIDRTLSTNNHEANRTLWKAAGYDEPPTIQEMIEELAIHEGR